MRVAGRASSRVQRHQDPPALGLLRLKNEAKPNGIADDFETARQGALPSAQTSTANRKAIAKAWKDAQGPGQGLTLSGKRPAPDRAVTLIPPGR